MRRMKLTVILGLLLAGTVLLTTGCAQPDDGTKIEKPSNNNNNNQGGNNQVDDSKYAQPFDRNLANGYVIRNFVGEGTAFPKAEVVEKANYYLGKAETYIKGMATNLNNDLKNRNTATQKYFKKFLDAVNTNNYQIDELYPSDSFDQVISGNSINSEYIFEDIIKNLDHMNQGYAFRYGFELLADEAYIENNNYGNVYDYKDRQEFAVEFLTDYLQDATHGVDFSSDLNSTDYPKTTKLLNELLDVAVKNMNANNGYNLTAADLRQVLNMGMTNYSLTAMHEATKANLNHFNCAASVNFTYVMDQAIETLPYTYTAAQSQDNGIER